MLVPELKKVSYDPTRFMDVENVDEAVNIILCPTEGMTAQQRWSEEAPALMRIMERFIKPKSLVLDYGCGIGRLAKPLIGQLSCEVIGVDISPNMRALATSLVDSPMFCAMDAAMYSKHLASYIMFDAAIAVWVLQHCLNLEEAISDIYVSLKPHGKLFVVNNHTRCVPVEGGEWADDGLDLDTMLTINLDGHQNFTRIASGPLDESVAPGWMQQGTYWAVYEKNK